jgi:hypothetical protein
MHFIKFHLLTHDELDHIFKKLGHLSKVLRVWTPSSESMHSSIPLALIRDQVIPRIYINIYVVYLFFRSYVKIVFVKAVPF